MYDSLYNSWLKEKENTELQTLPKDFYTKLTEYVVEIRQKGRMLDRNSPKAKLISQELTRVKRLMEELVKLRFKKIIELASSTDSFGMTPLTPEEEKAVSELKTTFESFQSFLKGALRGKKPKVENSNASTNPTKKLLLRFLQEVPAIIGSDLKVYGPFSIEDVATLPIENAKVLMKHGVATKVEIA